MGIESDRVRSSPRTPNSTCSVELRKYEHTLRQIRSVLAGDIDSLEADAFDTDGERSSVDNPADHGSDSFAQEFSLELLARDEATVGEIDRALKRFEEGLFGRCETCNQWIGRRRLTAVPHARNCIECQRQTELKG